MTLFKQIDSNPIHPKPSRHLRKVSCHIMEEHFIQEDPKLRNDSGEAPKLNGVVGGLILGCKIVSLLDRKLPRWSSVSCVPKILKMNKLKIINSKTI